jgi:hypothetical protein
VRSSRSFPRRKHSWIGSTETNSLRSGTAPDLDGRSDPTTQDAGVETDVWKIEGLDRVEDCHKSRRPPARCSRVGCIILGRGEDAEGLQWLTTAAR